MLGSVPELPEVETVRRGLQHLLGTSSVIARIELLRRDLRRRLPKALATHFTDQPITALGRRAKYLLFETPVGTLVSHLGMTGTWRLAAPGAERDHDHCYVHLRDGRRLAYRDPRRFGMLELQLPGMVLPVLQQLGPEPLVTEDFHATYLHGRTRGRAAALKTLIMDQRVVVGVGNIYAQEALFRAGLKPARKARTLRRSELERLVTEIRTVLTEAIAAGGSTISDFRQAGGDGGYFQHNFQVYDRAGQACAVCTTILKGGVVGGRGTSWCPRCQH